MLVKCEDIMNYMKEIAPEYLAEKWDNVGLLVGNKNSIVKKILIALDAIDSVVDEAVNLGIDLIITHHPIIFKPLKNITSETLNGKIYKLINNNISVYSAHTNFDITFGGTNDILAEKLGIKNIEILESSYTTNDRNYGIGRIGIVEKEILFLDYANIVKEKLGLYSMNIVGDIYKKINKVALCTGDGHSYFEIAAKKHADVYISGDLKYHDTQMAQELGMCCIDVTHYTSENIAMPVLREYLEKKSYSENWEVELFNSTINGQPFVSI